MRALLLTQHFPPEITAASFRVGPFAEALAARGHEVEVICPVPNHPAGVIEGDYRGRLLTTRSRDGIRVRHVWVYARPEKTFATRLGYYASYAGAACVLGMARRRADVVLASSPPLSVGAAGAVVAARHRSPLAFDVRDLWPESAVDFGELTNRHVVRAAERLERWLYRRADLIMTPNDAFRRTIELRGAGAPVEVVANGTTAEWLAVGGSEIDRADLGLPTDRFVWAYAGNLGLAHALDEAIDAAEMLGEGHCLLIIGDGPRRAILERKAARLPPGTVEFRGLMSPEEAARHLRAADAVLVAERQEKTVSAKLYDCSAVGRPLVAVCRGELERVVKAEGIGLPVPLDSGAEVAAAIRRLRSDGELSLALAGRARAFAERHLREREATRVALALEQLVA